MPLTEAPFVAAIAHDLPFGVWVAKAPGGELLYANAAFHEIMGVAPRSDIGVGQYAVPYGIHDRNGELYPEAKLPFARALAEKTTVVVDDMVIHRPNGTQINVRAIGKAMFDP